MKRTVCLFATCLLLLALAPAAMAQDEADPQALAPSVMLGEPYNPFYSYAFPESYTVTSAMCVLQSGSLDYLLTLTTPDAMNDVIAFVASIAPDPGMDPMSAAMSLMSDGSLEIEGGLGESSVRFRITDRAFGNAEAAGDRFEVTLIATMLPDEIYNKLFTTNLQYPLFGEIAEIMPLWSPDRLSMQVWPPDERAEMFISYSFDNAQQILSDLRAAYPDQYYADSDWLVWRLGKAQIAVVLSEVADGRLNLLVSFPSPDAGLLDGQAETTLQMLGFEDFRQTGAKCTYQDSQAGIYLSVSREEWGENGHTAERNALTCMAQESGAFLLIFYHPATQTYDVTLECDAQQASYTFFAAESRYANATGGDDLSDAIRVATKTFLAPGEEVDDVLALPLGLLQTYILETFGCTADELYAMDCE